jgi:hypothetical protein
MKPAPREDWPHLTNSERRKVATLQCRADWLRQRIEVCEVEPVYDKAELAALQWALGRIATLK